jgi:hypothetical protein
MIGDIYKLKVHCLSNPPGALGIVFYDYETGEQLIFPNGEYDGFDHKTEFPHMLQYIGHSEEHSGYQFKNVMTVSEDFRKGFWSSIFN